MTNSAERTVRAIIGVACAALVVAMFSLDLPVSLESLLRHRHRSGWNPRALVGGSAAAPSISSLARVGGS